jgi:paraquat-inducible protein A
MGTIAKDQMLARCHLCGKPSSMAGLSAHEAALCPRCGSHLELRVHDSVAKTWALLITAAVLMFPANLYPVMTVISFGKGNPDTIMSGVIMLIHHGMYPIAALVFVASVLVPLFKLAGFSVLLLAIQRGWKINHRQATTVYRVIHFIGRWSMLDLFMISILVTLVSLGKVATIETGPGATAFASVVVVTMLAAHTFDQRLIWDLLESGSPVEKVEK